MGQIKSMLKAGQTRHVIATKCHPRLKFAM